MKNIEMTLVGNILTLKVDISKDFGPSSSGKTIIVASTEGNQQIVEGSNIRIGLNIFKKK
jgi:hypothetical protein